MLKCICNLTYPAWKAHGPYYIVICGLWGSSTFLRISHKRHNFRENVIERKKFWFSIQLLRTMDFSVIAQREGVISYRRFGTTYRSHPQGSRIQGVKNSWPLYMGRIDCSETSVRNHLYSLRNNPEFHSSQLLRRRILKSRPIQLLSKTFFILSKNSARYYHKCTQVCM